MKKVAQMLYMLNMGGVESFLMNVYRNIDRAKYQFDFILQVDYEGYYEKEIESLGGKIYRIPRFEKHPIKHIKELHRILKNGDYIAFHRHTANSVVFYDMIIAKFAHIKNRIVHSHNTSHEKKMLNYICRPFLKIFSTQKLACGNEAGKWLYGKADFKVLNNGIDIQKFSFDEEIRKRYRKELNIEDKIAIGNVGRLEEQKNHRFLISMFAKLCEESNRYELILCGDGSLRNELENLCEEKNIKDKVKFLGNREDANSILQAMDIFVFPSLYEGLSLALIEAQLSGIPIIMSNKIATETIYNENVKMLEIEEKDINKWCTEISNYNLELVNRKNVSKKLIEDYDVNLVAKKLIKIYSEGK